MGTKQDLTKTFGDIYQRNGWGNKESRSGSGSTLGATDRLRYELPKLLVQLKAKTLLDIPCGDYHWMNHVVLPKSVAYIGADIVPEIIEHNLEHYPTVSFTVMDLVTDELPTVDVLLVRDVLGHLSNYNIDRAVRNIKMSGSAYLLTTTFQMSKDFILSDIKDGEWRPIDVEKILGTPPLKLIKEVEVKGLGMKYLGLWRLS